MIKSNKPIKKTILIGILIATAFYIFSKEVKAEERAPQLKRVSFRLSSGYSYLNIGDLNTWIDSWNYNYETWAVIDGYTVPEKHKNLHHGYNFAGEIMINLSPRWSAALGIGQINMKNNSTLIYRRPNNNETKHFLTNSAKVTPLTIGIYYSFPLLPKTSLFLNTGIGYYSAKISMDYDYQRPDDYWAKWQKNMSSSDLGFYGGMGFEWDIKKNLTLVFEARGQYAKIMPFEGTRKSENSRGYTSEHKGVFYTWNEWDTGVSSLRILPWRPEPAWNIKDIREFMLKLRGISLRIGIRIGIF